jgi:hypothetical protein
LLVILRAGPKEELDKLLMLAFLRAHGFCKHLRIPAVKNKVAPYNSLLSPPDHDLQKT